MHAGRDLKFRLRKPRRYWWHRSSARLRLIAPAVVAFAGLGSGASAARAEISRAAAPARVIDGLGQPDAFSYGVADLSAVRRQLAAATGTQFTATTTSTFNVTFPRAGITTKVTLAHTSSTRGGPHIELTHASAPIGPWSSSSRRSTLALSYSVADVIHASVALRSAGMELVAFSGRAFAYWRGAGGVLIRLIDADLFPASGASNDLQAPVDLGPPVAVNLAPCQPVAVMSQLAGALGTEWAAPQQFPLSYEFADGTTHLIDSDVTLSVAGTPFLLVEVPMHAPSEYACTPAATPAFPVFVSTDVPSAARQIEAAGMSWIARAPGLVSLHAGAGGILVEVADTTFLGATRQGFRAGAASSASR